MAWCPLCVWRRIGDDGRVALQGLPSRLPPPIRDVFVAEDLIELQELGVSGTFWRSTPRGRVVARAGESIDSDDEE